jgi:hypothetical protein
MNYIFSPNTQFLAVSSGHIGPHIPYELTDIPAGTRMFHGEATQPLIFVVAPRRGSKVVFLLPAQKRAALTAQVTHTTLTAQAPAPKLGKINTSFWFSKQTYLILSGHNGRYWRL